MHLKELKKVNPKAYEEYVALLVEDCQDEFNVDLTGKVSVYGSDRGYVFRGTFREDTPQEPWDIVFSSRY